MERDVARIDHMLSVVRTAWAEYPDMRLGQMLVNAIRPTEPCLHVFGIEDTILVRRLETLAKKRST